MQATGLLFQPWLWREGEAVKKAEDWLASFFHVPAAYTFDSGRSALYFALRALNLQVGDEVALQAYTCVVVSNAVRWTGGVPRYVDIRSDFNMDPADLRKKITAKTKVLIIQHTFGTPAALDELMSIAQERKLLVIEDCAHALGARYKDQLVGTFGDISIFSFGTDKVVSSVRGGALIAKDPELGQKIAAYQLSLPHLPLSIIAQHLLHEPIFYIGKAWYGLWIGKALLYAAKKIGLISKIIYPQEKRGELMKWFPARFPNVLARLLLPELRELPKLNAQRKQIASLYAERLTSLNVHHPAWNEDSIWLRYPVLVKNPKILTKKVETEGIFLGDAWYTTVVAPSDSDESIIGYTPGECPQAERFVQESFNLPTSRLITEADVDRICRSLTYLL